MSGVERERLVERRLIDSVKALGGLCIKLSATYSGGLPDRLIVINGKTMFAEVKSSVGRLTALQIKCIGELRAAGATVHIVRGYAGVDALIAELRHDAAVNNVK